MISSTPGTIGHEGIVANHQSAFQMRFIGRLPLVEGVKNFVAGDRDGVCSSHSPFDLNMSRRGRLAVDCRRMRSQVPTAFLGRHIYNLTTLRFLVAPQSIHGDLFDPTACLRIGGRGGCTTCTAAQVPHQPGRKYQPAPASQTGYCLPPQNSQMPGPGLP